MEIPDQTLQFIQAAEGQWIDIQAGDSSSGNKKVKLMNKIVQQWGRAGVATERLQPLLNHSSPSVRLAAAAYLAKLPNNDPAIMVLRSLANEPEGMIAVSAGAVLRVHKIPSE